MECADAYTLISRAIDTGHAAHGYLICGDLKGQCDALVERILAKLFPNALAQVAAHSHPDVAYLAPSGKSRTIKVARTDSDPSPGMRDAIIEPMSTTAFSGGWKVGIITGADRLQPAAANAFLKLLEEPPSKTLFLLTTDTPDAILPTIVSRTQRIDLPLSEGLLEGESYAAVREIFERDGDAARRRVHGDLGTCEKAAMGRRLAEILAELKDAAEDEDVALVRKSFFKTILSFVRGWMIAGKLPLYRAFRNVEAVEEAYRQSDRALNDEAVLCFLMDRLTFPQ